MTGFLLATLRSRPYFSGLLLASLLGLGLGYAYRRHAAVELESLRSTSEMAESPEEAPLSRLEIPEPLNPKLASQLARVDASRDAWESEVVTQSIDQQLRRVAQAVLADQTDPLSESEHESLFAAGFHAQVARADQSTMLPTSGGMHIRRSADAVDPEKTLNSPAELIAYLKAGARRWERLATKVIGIDLTPSRATAEILIESLHRDERGLHQQNQSVTTEWIRSAEDPPRLLRWRSHRSESVLLEDQQPLFEEITDAVLGNTIGFDEQVRRGLDYWSQRLTGLEDMHIVGHHGVAIADVNGDGLEDIYVCDSGGLPNRLYLQQADGRLRDVSTDSGADWLESTTSALLVDLDNDGDPDLIAATIAGVVIAENNGKGVFRIRHAMAGLPEAHTLSAADYDNDGDLDLYVTNYGPGGAPGGARGVEASAPIPYYNANNGGRNVLLANEGAFRFRDVTERTGLDHHNRRWSFAAAWEDFDQDGDMDLYVANDFGRNNLYLNTHGRFRDVAEQMGVEDIAGGMSATWGDGNRDGQMDIYVGNMFSAAGRRVTYQRQFVDANSGRRTASIQRMARGNTLFLAGPDGRFHDASLPAGVTMGRWAWGSKFADLDNDGWEDILVANGYFTSEKQDDL